MVLLSSAYFFFKINVFKFFFRNTIRVSNGLDLDQDRHSTLVLTWVQTVSKDYQQTSLR